MRKKILYIILLLIHFTANAGISFDESLIRDWSSDRQNAEPCPLPFLAKYTGAGKNLLFVAAKHGEGPPEENQTFKLIKGTFQKYRPSFLIVEKQLNSLGISNQERVKDALSCQKNQFRKCTERQYAIYHAIQQKVPFAGGEPDDSVYLRLVPKYSKLDVVGFFSYVNLVRWKRRGQTDFQKAWETEKASEEMQKRFNYEMSFHVFKKWFEDKVGKPLTPENVDSQQLAPIKDSQNFVQKISYDQDPIREPEIIKVIEKTLNENPSVLVVYGGGHHVKDRLVFEKALGVPSFECE